MGRDCAGLRTGPVAVARAGPTRRAARRRTAPGWRGVLRPAVARAEDRPSYGRRTPAGPRAAAPGTRRAPDGWARPARAGRRRAVPAHRPPRAPGRGLT